MKGNDNVQKCTDLQREYKKVTNNYNILYKFQQQIESEAEPWQQKATKWKDVSYKIQNKIKLVKTGKL